MLLAFDQLRVIIRDRFLGCGASAPRRANAARYGTQKRGVVCSCMMQSGAELCPLWGESSGKARQLK